MVSWTIKWPFSSQWIKLLFIFSGEEMSLTTTSPVLVAKVTLAVCISCAILRSLCGSEAASGHTIQEDFSWCCEQSFKCVFIYKPSAVSFISEEKEKKNPLSSCIHVWKYPALTIVMFSFHSPALSALSLWEYAAVSVPCWVRLSRLV